MGQRSFPMDSDVACQTGWGWVLGNHRRCRPVRRRVSGIMRHRNWYERPRIDEVIEDVVAWSK